MMRFNYGQTPRSGFRLGFGPGTISPFIKVMIIANAGVFLAQNLYPQLTPALGLTPKDFFSEFPNLLYQPLTYMFLHGGIIHIFFNMLILWMFGTEIELAWGTRVFGRFYVLGGLAGALLTLIFSSAQPHPVIGASAAIYSVLTAYWLMFPNRYLFFLVSVKVKWAIPGFMILGSLVFGRQVALLAHLGGILFALLYIKGDWRWALIGRRIRRWRYGRQEAKLQKNRQRAEDVMKRVDAILDKINRVGIDNLTKAERKFLEEASSELSRRNGKD